MALLEAEGITKNFGGLQALCNVDFHISKGELVSIVGPNGSGKTTLFNVLLAFINLPRAVLSLKEILLADSAHTGLRVRV